MSDTSKFVNISIGFKSSLNYEFVSSNSYSSAQIFAYLPNVLSYPFTDSSGNLKRDEIYRLFGRDISDSDMELFNSVTVLGLVPYTVASKSYAVTLADVVFPKKYVDKLSSLLTDTSSKLYTNPSKIAEQLASQIDPTIPLNILINIATGLTESSSSSSSSSDGLGTLGGSISNSYSKKSYSSFLKDKKTRVAFFVCLAVGCTLYIIMMVLVCKKFLSYMKKKYPSRVIQVPVEGSFIVDPFEEFNYRSSMMSNAAKEGNLYSDMLFKRGSMFESKPEGKSEKNTSATESSVSSASISSYTTPETVSIKKAKLASEKSRLSKLYVYDENNNDIYADQISMTPSVKIDRWMDFNASEVMNIANLVDNSNRTQNHQNKASNMLNSDSSNSFTGSMSSNKQLLAQYLGRKQPPLPPPNWKEIMGTMNSSLQNNKGSTFNSSEMNSSDGQKKTFDETDTFGWNRKEE